MEDNKESASKELSELNDAAVTQSDYKEEDINGLTTNDKSTDDNDQGDDSGEPLFTLNEIIDLQEQMDAEAEALLGGQNDMVCTYPEGYKFRQPLYSCKTCSEKNGQLAGVCYACSLNCHSEHELVELYTKRKFSCDCGNSKFDEKCKLFEEKSSVNSQNKYNHNFRGIYCICKKPYPPEEENETVGKNDKDTDLHLEMFQCCLCEDWFHLPHIFSESEVKSIAEKKLPTYELLCRECVSNFPFTLAYSHSSVLASDEVLLAQDGDQRTDPSQNIECKLKAYKSLNFAGSEPRSLLMPDFQWRLQLCKCKDCMNIYEDTDCLFLLDPEDTLDFYDQQRVENMALRGETSSNNENETIYDYAMSLTQDRDIALTVSLEVEAMKRHVGQMLNECVGNGKKVTKEIVEKCFDELRAKRPRLMDSVMENKNKDAGWTE